MVLNDLQAPAGEETGDGASDAVDPGSSQKQIDTPVGPAAGVFVSGRAIRNKSEEICQMDNQ